MTYTYALQLIKKVILIIFFCFQVMFTTLSSYNGCVCVCPGDRSLVDHGAVLPTWLHLHQGRENNS